MNVCYVACKVEKSSICRSFRYLTRVLLNLFQYWTKACVFTASIDTVLHTKEWTKYWTNFFQFVRLISMQCFFQFYELNYKKGFYANVCKYIWMKHRLVIVFDKYFPYHEYTSKQYTPIKYSLKKKLNKRFCNFRNILGLIRSQY